MPRPLLLDSNILSQIVQPTAEENRPVVTTVVRLLRDTRFRVYVPEIIDYELRRKLLHLAQRPHQARKWAQEALIVLDQLVLTGRRTVWISTSSLPLKHIRPMATSSPPMNGTSRISPIFLIGDPFNLKSFPEENPL